MFQSYNLILFVACKYDGECHAVNAVWHHAACHWLKCTMTRKANSISFNIDSVEQGNANTYHRCNNNIDKVYFSKNHMDIGFKIFINK